MARSGVWFLLSCLLFLLPVAAVAAPPAQEGPNRAALVIRTGEEEVETYCVSFSEPEITGYEMLQRAGRQVLVGDAGLGVTVCQIDEVGCPAGNCFCRCQGDPCVYWSYWHRQQDGWQYAVVGASSYQVQPGAVEGWSWGPGSVTEAIPPPELTFDEVCTDETAGVTGPAAAATGTPAADAEALAARAAPTATPVAAAVANVAEPAADTSGLLYGLFALIVVSLGGLLWWLQRRGETA